MSHRNSAPFSGGLGDNTPLHDAVRVADEAASRRMVELMLQGSRRVDLAVRNKQRKTAADVARHETVKRLLLQHRGQQLPPSPSKKPKASPGSKGRDSAQASSTFAGAPGSPSIARADRPPVENCAGSPRASLGTAEAPAGEAIKTLSMEERLAAMREILKANPRQGCCNDREEDVPEARDAPADSREGAVRDTTTSTPVPDDSSPARRRLAFTHSAGAAAEHPLTSQDESPLEMEKEECAEDDAVVESAAAAGGQDADGQNLCLVNGVQEMLVSGRSWELRFTREFKEQMFAMHSTPVQRDSLIRNILRLAHGEQVRLAPLCMSVSPAQEGICY